MWRTSIKRGVFGILGLFLLAGVAGLRTLPTSPLPASAPAERFSAVRAAETVAAVGSAPRLVGSPAFESAKDFLLAHLSALGLETEEQNTVLDGVKVENVLARLNGSFTNDAILLSAHLDSVANSPGATDDGSGVAAILETVRALRSGPALRNTVIVLITAPEEDCCFGAEAFVSEHPWTKDIHLVVNLDAGGLNGPSILAATAPNAGWLIEKASGIIPHPVASSAIEELGNPATDYTRLFREKNWMGFDFNLSWSKRIHSQADTIDNLDLASLQHQGEHLLAVTRYFGNQSLSFPPKPRPIYFDVFGLTIVHYPSAWVILLFLLGFFLSGSGLFLGLRRKYLSWRGIGIGTLTFFLSLVSVPAILLFVQSVLINPVLADPSRSAALVANLMGETYLSEALRWGSIALAAFLAFLWHRLASRWGQFRRHDYAFAAYGFLGLAGLAASITKPGISYLFTWPLLAGMAALHFLLADRFKPVCWIAVFLAGAVALVLFVPGLLIAGMSIEIQSVYLLPVFVVALIGWLFLPLQYFLGV